MEAPSDKSQQSSSPRDILTLKYRDLVADQTQAPDKIFLGGFELRDLDPAFIFLDENAREHPRSWTFKKKVQTTALMASFCFLSPFASTIFAPSIRVIAADLAIIDSTVAALQVSIFLFAYAAAPLFLAPLSEKFGRTIILHIGNLAFIAFSVGGGFAQTTAQLSVCRFLAGLGGSSGLAVVGGAALDIWDLGSRPKASGLIMLGPILGPVLGPVCGGWMSARASWRWTLWVPAIGGAVLAVAAIFWLHESYAPWILETKVRKARKSRPADDVYSVLDLDSHPTGLGFLLSQFARPLIYLLVDPALALAALFYSVTFGVVYLVVVTYSDVFGNGYHHSVGIVGTDFLAIGVGMIIGTAFTMKLLDVVFKKDRHFKPESRLLSSIPGLVLAVGGLFMYGFSALKTHFIVPLIGVALFAAGVMNIMMSVQLYTIESFDFPASAFAAITVIRCLFGGAFPLFGAKLFVALGIDWGVGLLAFITLAVGLPFIPLMYKYSPRLRQIGAKNLARLEGKREGGVASEDEK